MTTPINDAEIRADIELAFSEDPGIPEYKTLLAARRLATACQRLLDERPKVWTAETIEDAPEGFYRMKRIYADSQESEWTDFTLSNLPAKAALSKTLELPVFDAAFGPIPQTPEPTNADR